MIALNKKDRSRQDRVWIDGQDYLIHTEFYHWIAFGKKFENMHREGIEKFSLCDLDYLYKVITLDGVNYGIPENKLAGYEELCKFYNNEQPLPRPIGKTNIIGIDWLIDSEYIYSAFLQQYGIDLIKTDLHWHDFLSLFNGLRETKLNDIMSSRFYTNTKSKKDPMEESRKAWELESFNVFKNKIFELR